MKIRDYLLDTELKRFKARLRKLKEFNAPKIMVASLSRIVENMERGEFIVNGQQTLLLEECKSHEVKKGRGGKEYIIFNEDICYFPSAQYGRFITNKKEEFAK